MPARPRLQVLAFLLAAVALLTVARTGYAQSDDVSLGDVARAFRKNQEPPQKVIDNDNLPQVMDDGESKKWAASTSRLRPVRPAVQLINFQSPNVTCALSFNANSPELLANAPRPQRLPDTELAKLDGPATIIGNTLELSVLNATAWDVREITVGLTIIRKQLTPAAFLGAAARLVPATAEVPRSDRKQADLTLVYHMHGAAAPYSSAVFREELDRPLEADEEWHWAILQAKGMPPAPDADQSTTAAQIGTSATSNVEASKDLRKDAAPNSPAQASSATTPKAPSGPQGPPTRAPNN